MENSKLPRLYHKKSRNGCQRCRARRVKCDESRPICSSCNRHSVHCVYDTTNSTLSKTLSSSKSRAQYGPPLHTPGSSNLFVKYDNTSHLPLNLRDSDTSLQGTFSERFDTSNSFDIAESKPRRLLELRLLENFISSTSHSFSHHGGTQSRHTWSVEVPKLALQNDNLLYGMFSISALHLLKSKPNDMELIAARRIYLGLSLSKHRLAVADLNSRSADSICFSSVLVMLDVFASLQERLIEPYSSPMQWMRVARGTGSMFKIALNTIDDYDTAKITTVVKNFPVSDSQPGLFGDGNPKTILGLLSQILPAGDALWDQDTREAYEKTLSYIDSIQLAITEAEGATTICHRIMGFPYYVPNKFIEFVEEQRPRALVFLAYFFALSTNLRTLWLIGKTPQREVGGIYKVLPVEWHHLMRWPLAMVGLPSE